MESLNTNNSETGNNNNNNNHSSTNPRQTESLHTEDATIHDRKRSRNSSLCGICDVVEFKYKCPLCELKYCSVVCFKKHKEVPCSNSPKQIPPPKNEFFPQRYNKEESYEVTQKEFDLLAATPGITDALKDSRLQELIKAIDKYYSPTVKKQKLDQMMENIPEFNTFVDTMLKTIFVRNEDGQSALYG